MINSLGDNRLGLMAISSQNPLGILENLRFVFVNIVI